MLMQYVTISDTVMSVRPVCSAVGYSSNKQSSILQQLIILF